MVPWENPLRVERVGLRSDQRKARLSDSHQRDDDCVISAKMSLVNRTKKSPGGEPGPSYSVRFYGEGVGVGEPNGDGIVEACGVAAIGVTGSVFGLSTNTVGSTAVFGPPGSDGDFGATGSRSGLPFSMAVRISFALP